ncbi:MAG: hypothetical protein ACI88H_002588 [Cocleimonas sp.]
MNTKLLITVLNRIFMIMFLALFLQACEFDDGTDTLDEDDEDVTVTYTTDSGVSTLENDDLYELIVNADSTILTLEDDISEVTLIGDSNYLLIDSDTSID